MSRYHYDATLTFEVDGGELEIDVTVSYAVSFGCPAQTYGPAERCYPAEDPEVTDITLLKVGDRFRPWGFHHWSDSHFGQLAVEQIEASERDLLAMIEAASEDEAGIEDVIAERRWTERREEASV